MPGSDTVWMTLALPSTSGGATGEFLEGPDIEAAVIAWLSAANLTNVGVRVYSKVPDAPTFPLITIARVGGIPPVRPYLDMGNIQVDVWGGTKQQALDIAQAARMKVLEMEGATFISPSALFVTAVEDSLGMTWQPDEETGRERYLFGVNVYAHSL